MSLQQALDDCLIDFDRRVLVTDLLEEYKLTYKEAHDALEAHIKEQERASANKYAKRFLVHGLERAGSGDVDETRELFKIVQGEDKLKEWLAKLQNSQSQLYSVEIAGGSKSAAPIFKPMQQVQVKVAKLEHRAGATTAKPTSNGTTEQAAPKPISTKVEPKAETAEEPPKKTSPSEQQKGKGKEKAGATKKGGINSFFSAAPAAAAKTQQQQPKEAKPAASSSMESFFKKQPAAKKSPPTESVKKELPAASNTSVQLFDVESEASSDEEEKLDKLRRKVVGDGDESDEVGDNVKNANSKRRRISDSEDEEQPQKKSAETPQHMKQKDEEKKKEEADDDEAMDVAEAETATNETFLDDDGFVITVRPKKQMQQKQPAKKKTSPKAAAAATSAASSASSTKKKSPTAAASKSSVKETPKTKQGNIMSFFSKKWMCPPSLLECCSCCFGFSILELMLPISRI